MYERDTNTSDTRYIDDRYAECDGYIRINGMAYVIGDYNSNKVIQYERVSWFISPVKFESGYGINGHV